MRMTFVFPATALLTAAAVVATPGLAMAQECPTIPATTVCTPTMPTGMRYCLVNVGKCETNARCLVNVGYCEDDGRCTVNVGYCDDGDEGSVMVDYDAT